MMKSKKINQLARLFIKGQSIPLFSENYVNEAIDVAVEKIYKSRTNKRQYTRKGKKNNEWKEYE